MIKSLMFTVRGYRCSDVTKRSGLKRLLLTKAIIRLESYNAELIQLTINERTYLLPGEELAFAALNAARVNKVQP